jgi:hypothetical protein
MNELPQWITFGVALVVPAIAIVGFWMTLSAGSPRLNHLLRGKGGRQGGKRQSHDLVGFLFALS